MVSMINSFHTVAPNSLNSNQVSAPLLVESFQKLSRELRFERSQHDKTKQNKLPCFIDI